MWLLPPAGYGRRTGDPGDDFLLRCGEVVAAEGFAADGVLVSVGNGAQFIHGVFLDLGRFVHVAWHSSILYL